MSVRRVALSRCTPQPWRNGGGTTRELLAWPTAGDWLVRVSVAEVAADGPFSAFPGVDRWFAVLEGAGVALGLPGGERTVVRGDAPLHFAGEDAPACRLLDGPTRDLNLMARRGSGGAAMWPALPGSGVDGPRRWRALFAAGEARLETGDGRQRLGAGTLAWTDARDARWRLLDGAAAFWMMLDR